MTQEPCLSGGPEENPFVVFLRDPVPPAEVGLPNYWVNTSSLALVIQDTIFRYQGLGPEIAGTLTYQSGSTQSGLFGPKWRFSYESDIQVTGNTVSVSLGSGKVVRYTRPPAPPQPGQPVEMVPSDPGFDRLLDYGTYWLFIEKISYRIYRYDKAPGSPRALLSTIADSNGNTVRINYTQAGTPLSVTDAAGRTLMLHSDTAGRCMFIRFPDGRQAAFQYDPAGRLSRSTDFEGIPSEYTYDNNHCITSMVVAKDRKTTRFSYGGQGTGIHVTSVTDPVGHVQLYEVLSDAPRRVRVRDPENNETIYQSTGGVTETIENGAFAVRFSYDAKWQRTSATSRLGRTIRSEYDYRGNITRIIDPLGHQFFYAWNEYDRLTAMTDALGNVTRITYDARQNPVAIVSPSGYTHQYAYDQLGQLIRYTMPGGGVHAFTYDRFGNLSGQTSPSGGSITFDYDPSGRRLTGFTDANRNRTSYTYDKNDRLTRIVRPDGSVKEYTYGCCAGLSTKDENGEVSRFTRDPRLLITEMTDAAGHSLRFTYDRLHRLTSITDPLGSVTTMQCSDPDLTVTLTDPAGRVIRNAFDLDGNLLTISDPAGVLYQYGYDACGWLASYTDAAGGSERYERDAAGRITRVQGGRGIARSYTYTPEGRVKEKFWDSTRCAACSYDNDGNLVALNDSTGRTEYRWDSGGQVSGIVFPGNRELSCSYDPMGNLRSIRYPDGLEAGYTCDAEGRITRIRFGSDSISFGYDPAGNLVSESRSNGVDSRWGHDANGSITEIRHSRGEVPVAHHVYQRDANRNIIQERALLPLQPEKQPGPFAVTGNRIGQIVQSGSQEFRYDPDGNLVLAGGGILEGRYDPENRLVRAERNGRVVESGFNALCQRTSVTAGEVTRRMYYDLYNRLLSETDAAGVVTDYIYAGGVLVARYRAGEAGFYHFDKTGNTLCITGRDGGIAAAYAYDTFGMVTGRTAAADPNPFTFVGRYGVVDDGDGLFLMKRRHYDAVTGRFIQRDPIGIQGGLNLYAYAGNNPVTQIDPEGTDFGLTLMVIGTLALAVSIASYGLQQVRPENNTVIRALGAASDKIGGKISGDQMIQTIGPNPGQNVQKEIVGGLLTAGDKAIGFTPFGPGYKGVKLVGQIATGQPGAAIETGASLIPGLPGQVAGTAVKVKNAVIDVCNAPK
jgi:RHS repeat-associated protein